MVPSKSFTVREPDICVKCAQPIAVGQEICWLREADRKGYYHANAVCIEKPIIMALTRVRHEDASSPFGYAWVREKDLPMQPVVNTSPAKTVEPAVSESAPVINADGIIVNAVAKALLPALGKMIAEMKGPRIVCNVYVAKAGEETKALDLLSKELFLLQSTQEGL